MEYHTAHAQRLRSWHCGRFPRVGMRGRAVSLVLVVAGLGALGFLAWRSPVGAVPACPTWSVLGVHCPGCGSLRATHHLLHARVGAALDHNPVLVVLGVPLAAYFGVELAMIAAAGRRFGAWGRGAWTAWVVLAVLMLFTLARNLPMGAALRPPEASGDGAVDLSGG